MSTIAMLYLKSILGGLQARFEGKALSLIPYIGQLIKRLTPYIFVFFNVFVVAQAYPQENFGATKARTEVNSNQSYDSENMHAARLRNELINAKSVMLIFEYPHAEHILALNEDGLRDAGCKYFSLNKKEISDLAEIIMSELKGGAVSNENAEQQEVGIDVREAVYFNFSDTTETKFLFEEPYVNDRELVGRLNERKIIANPELVNRLYRWAGLLDRSARNAGSELYSSGSRRHSNLWRDENDRKAEACMSFVKRFSN